MNSLVYNSWSLFVKEQPFFHGNFFQVHWKFSETQSEFGHIFI